VLDIAQPLAGYDAECAAIVREQLAREGVVLRGGAEIAEVKQTRSKIQVLLRTADGEEKIDGSHLLVAAGEAPNIEALNLFAAGIKYSRTGITVDKGLKTANKKVYAIGAVAGGPGDAAEDQAAQVIRNALFRQRVRGNPRDITQVIHTDPEFAQVGLTEADAAVQRLAVRVLRWPYRENDRAQAEKEVQGHIKVITSTRGKILGAAIVGVRAGDLITPWSLAISHGMNVGAVAGLAVPYRTFAEVSKRAAMSYFAPGLGGQWLRRAMGALRLLG
jgi:pyruvate/2-oxoglutarate dehydrogenase complex dihydrolipoamide dehydrogenase (E3) component